MKIIYFDSENLLSYKEIKKLTLIRYKELSGKKFTHEQIMTIIFDCRRFKECFINEKAFVRLKESLNSIH